jgi:hypothetical protein
MKLKNIGLLSLLVGGVLVSACNFGGGSSGGGNPVNAGDFGDIKLQACPLWNCESGESSTVNVGESIVIWADTFNTGRAQQITFNFSMSNDDNTLTQSSCTSRLNSTTCFIELIGVAPGPVTITAKSIFGFNPGSITIIVK